MALAGAGAGAQPTSDWERRHDELNWRELDVVLPAYPAAERLVEFYVSPSASFRFFLDRSSLSVGGDGVVRYAMVARSPSGTENVSFEGIRCKTAHFKVYAFGRADRTWNERPSDWKPLELKSMNRQHQALHREYLCPNFIPVESVAEAIDALSRSTRR